MALRGTLKDFGVAEILQLIAQQTKTGILRLRNRDEEVHVHFDAGNVVRAEQMAGKERHLFGHRLVRAGLVSEQDLDDALEEQRRTLRRLGDVLISRGAISVTDLREMAQLQATETLYRLFTWKSGTYEFEATEVAWDRTSMTPIRGEAILMEGFRMVDEWPLIRRKIGSKRMTFAQLRVLPAASADEGGEAIGPAERRVMELVQPGRTVERIVELSRLGEFETCKALLNLVEGGWLEAIAPPDEEGRGRGGALGTALGRAGGFLLQVAVTAGLLAALAGGVFLVRSGSAAGSARGVAVPEQAAQRLATSAQLARIRAALDVYRLEAGRYPESLDELLEAGLLAEDDLRHPWRDRYHYRPRPDEGTFVLLPPLR